MNQLLFEGQRKWPNQGTKLLAAIVQLQLTNITHLLVVSRSPQRVVVVVVKVAGSQTSKLPLQQGSDSRPA